jgi:hypothetical protein
MSPTYLIRKIFSTARHLALFVVLIFLFLGVGIGAAIVLARNNKQPKLENSQASLVSEGGDTVGGGVDQKLTVNAQLQVKGQFYLVPQTVPQTAATGTIIFDKVTNTLKYYNGKEFVTLADQSSVPQQTPSGVTSLQGQTGAIQFTPGPGIAINGLAISNSGLLGINGVPGDINVTTANGIATITLPQPLSAGASPSFAGLSLGSALTVGNGGTGATSLDDNGVVVSHGTGALTSVAAGTPGLCLISTAAAPEWGLCAGGGGAGVASLNGLMGSLSIANASGLGTTVTIDNASTSAKGIASFNSTNFSVTSGAVNTIQSIATSASPTFAGLTLSSALTVSNGGTGLTSLTSNAVLVGNGTGAIQRISSGGAGECLISTSGAPIFTTCPGSGGVASIDGQTGVVTMNNATGTGGVITIDDASTSQKGIAQFNGTNFSVTSGVVNTIQGIATSSSPTFAGLTLSSALSVANGGTGAASLTGNAVLIGNGTGAIQVVAAGGAGQCLISTAGAPAFSSCPGSGGVSSVNSFNGAVTIQGTANQISVANNAGIITLSTPQNIATGSSPTFAGLTLSSALTVGNGGTGANTAPGARTSLGAAASGANGDITSTTALNTITPSAALTVGSTSYSLTLQGTSASTLKAVSGAFTTTIGFTTPTANATINFPALSAGTYDVCTSSGNCLGGGTGGANTALSNLASVAINTALLPGSTSIDLGSNAAAFRDLYIGGTVTNNFRITGTATGARTITLPDATGTVCLSTGNCVGGGGGSAPAGADYITLSGNGSLSAERTLTAGANISFTDGGANSTLTVSTVANPNFTTSVTTPQLTSTGGLSITPGGALTVGATSQSFTLQGANASTITATSGANVTTVGFAAPTASATINFPALTAGTYTICTSSGNCAASGVTQLNTFTGAITIQGTTNQVTVNNNTGVITLSTPQDIATSSSPTFAGLTLSSALTVGNGGTGASSLTANAVLIGNGTGAVQIVSAGGSGLCLVSTLGAPTFSSCPGSGGVSSVDGLTGALTVANSSGVGTTITIDDAAYSAKGIAQFNSTNFSVVSGAVNTIQGISTGSSPTFAGLTLTSLTVGADTVTDFTGTGLTVSSGALQTTLGVSVDLASEVTGILPIANGGTGAITSQAAINALSQLTTNGDLLYHNGTNSTRLARGSNGQCLTSNTTTLVWGSCGAGVATIGTLDSQAASTNGAVISGTALYLQSASATMPGLVNTTTQTFAGNKTFSGNLTVSADVDVAGSFNSPYGGFGVMQNLLSGSEALDNGSLWAQANITSVTNGATAPNGEATADTIVSSGSGTHTLTQTYGTSTNGNYNFSIWLKTNSGTQSVDLRIDSAGATPGTGTPKTVTATTTWQRFDVAQSFSGTPSNVRAVIRIASNSATIVGWGAQLRAGTVPGVYTYSGYRVATARPGLAVQGDVQIASGGTIYIGGDQDCNNTACYGAGNITNAGNIDIRANGGTLDLWSTGTTIHSFLTVTDGITVPGTGTGSEAFGNDADAAGDSSLAVGAGAGALGQESVAVGGLSVASWFQSVALGWQASAGDDYAIALGANASASNANSIALGYSSTASAQNAIAIGLTASAAGLDGIAIGRNASAGGSRTVALGVSALQNAGGDDNIAIGAQALQGNTTGGSNVAIGSYAQQTATGDFNVGVGQNALNEVTGDANTALGHRSLESASSADGNVGLGNETLRSVNTGDYNIAIGNQTGTNITTGSNNIIIGSGLSAASATGNYQLNIANLLNSSNYQTGNLIVGTSDTTGQLLVLDTKTGTGDPAGQNGGMYYNSGDGKFRCYQNGTWVDCITSPGGLYTDSGAFAYLTQTTDNLTIGGSINGGSKLEVVGDINSKGLAWTMRAAIDNQWNSVTYGNGLFVAVSFTGTGNRVMTSPDGINWTPRSSAADNTWRSVTYGNGLFVAVSTSGTGNRVMTSPDGINWTIRTSASDSAWASVTYGNGTFVAVSTGGTVMTSVDGIFWVTRTAAAVNGWNSVTYGNGLFVAVSFTGTGNRVMTSPDGINWTSRTSAADNQWNSVTYGNGLFVAVSSDGTDQVMTSPDGITWTSRTTPEDDNWGTITYGNGLFVAAGQLGTAHQVMTSSDGFTWTLRDTVNMVWQSIVYGNGTFVAVANSNGGSPNKVMTSGKVEAIQPTNSNMYQGGVSIYAQGTGSFISNGSSANLFQVQDANGMNLLGIKSSSTNNLITNASAENGVGGWSARKVSASAVLTASGDFSLYGAQSLKLVTGTTVSNGAFYAYPFKLSTTYTLSAWMRKDASSTATINVGYAATPYATGTAGTSGATTATLTGTGTTWTAAMVGSMITFANGQQRYITARSSNTSITLSSSISLTNGTFYEITQITDCLTGQTVNTTWTQYICTFTTGSTVSTLASSIYIRQTDAASDNIYIDGVTLVTGSTALTYSETASSLQVDTTGGGTVTILNGSSGEIGPWQQSPNSLPAARDTSASVTANGYIYVLGGWDPIANDVTDTVYYAKLNADGSTGAWTSTTSLPWASSGAEALYLNGYIYQLGGSDINYGGNMDDTLYAKVNSDGTLGAWKSTIPMPTVRYQFSATTYNGYIYAFGGTDLGGSNHVLSSVHYAKVNPDGTVSAWQTNSYDMGCATPGCGSPVALRGQSTVIANGYVYILGGYKGDFDTDIAYYAPFNANGSIGAWTQGPNMPDYKSYAEAFTNNGYVYIVGGLNSIGNPSALTYYARLNPDGSLGTWRTSTAQLPHGFAWQSMVLVSGYAYVMAGYDGVMSQASVLYARIGSTLQVGGNLDLVGQQGQSLNGAGDMGGSLTAGSGTFVGGLQVQGAASFSQGVSIGDVLSVGGGINVTAASRKEGVWTAHAQSAVTSGWTSITYGNSLFVAVADTGTNRVMTSPDGITWTARTAAAVNSWSSVTYGNGQFVAVASSAGGTDRVMTSPDGITWTIQTAAAANSWKSVTYGNGLFVAVGTGGGSTTAMTSPDGITWTLRTAYSVNWASVTYGNGLFVTVGSGGYVATSPDGITWTTRIVPEANTWRSVTYGNGQFVAVSQDGTNRVMTSPDGIAWTAQAAEASTWQSVTYGNGQFVAVASNATYRGMTSADGINWTPRTLDANTWASVTYGAGQFVAVSSNGTNRVVTGVIVGSNLAIQAQGDTLLSGNLTVSGSTNFGGTLTIGAADTNGVLLVLDTKTSSGDPAGTDGAMYYNSNSKSFRCYSTGAWRSCIGGLVAANTSVPGGNTVANTVSATNFASNYSILANDCQPGKVYRVTAQGVYGTTGTPNLTVQLRFGSTVIASTATNATSGTVTNQPWRIETQVTCYTAGGSGTVEGQGFALFSTAATTAQNIGMVNTSTVVVDTTAAQTLQLNTQWGAANSLNTITLRQFIVESVGL